ncbi:haloacid dehalogenase [Rhodothalassium salexigens]|uniref:HAD-IA family hydrolase n=1 Tax=Rhodothalassium salexigens TaxID=1086 RepID=UPI001911E620|nr:HAD-IA family hydrolase [Rhodothalassium salexigens]MBK5912583.1 haloacid dehalogenase [Rhodothalassium salexigens]MBK5919637.1 haloacid dehalogenase [Rhodothalassium salexigens]
MAQRVSADRPLRLVVFDCDGTLVDSQGIIVRTMERVFDAAGLPRPDANAVRRVVGLSLPEAIAHLLPDLDAPDHHELAGHYKRAFADMRAAGGDADETLYPGIAALLAALDDAGYLMGVATGKSSRGLALTLDRYGLARYFITLQTADLHPSKPHPAMLRTAIAEAGAEPEQTVLIGDTRYDMAMARSAGAHGLGVTWGYHPGDELIEAGARGLADRAADVPALVAGLID